jgi:ribosomal protein S18 acetylase RimI-like enzyme
MQNNHRADTFDRLWDIVRLDWVRYHYYTRKTLANRSWNDSTHLWLYKGELVGVVLFEERDFYTIQIEPEYEQMGLDLIPEMAAWAKRRAMNWLDAEGVSAIEIEIDLRDHAYREAFTAIGYEATDEYMIIYDDLDLTQTLPESRIPDGFVLRNVSSDADLKKKYVVNSAAFNNFGLYEEDTFFTLREAPFYDQNLDLVIEDAGVFAATCTAWYDAEHQRGYIEPLGVHPEYQRKGLGKAIVCDALQRLHAIGARRINMVSTESARMFYESLGFREISRSYGYSKILPSSTAGRAEVR